MRFLAQNFGLKFAFLYKTNVLAPFDFENAIFDTTRSAARSELGKLLPPLTGVKCEPVGSLPRYLKAAR